MSGYMAGLSGRAPLPLSEITVSATPSVAEMMGNEQHLAHCDGWGRGDRAPFAGLRNEPAPPFHGLRSEPVPSPLSSVSWSTVSVAESLLSTDHKGELLPNMSPCSGWGRGERVGERVSERAGGISGAERPPPLPDASPHI